MPVRHLDPLGLWYDISKLRAGKTAAISLPSVSAAVPSVDPTIRPTGPEYVTYESLYVSGDTVTQAMARLTTAKYITFPEGVFACNDFATGYQAGITIPPVCKGIIGSGRGSLGSTSSGTIFTMTPNSSTAVAKGWIPAQGTSTPIQCYVLKHYPTSAPTYKNFQIAGTPQGHNFSGMQSYAVPSGGLIENVLISGWEGDNGAPPGETFALGFSGGPSGGSGYVMRKLEIDGRRTPGGQVFGAAGITFQNAALSLFDQCNIHHCRAACAVFYQTFSSELRDCVIDSDSAGSLALGNGGINLERTAGCKLVRPTILGRANKVHITHSNDTFTPTYDGVTYSSAGGSLDVIDPVWNSVFGNGYLYIQTWTPYSLGSFGTGNSMTYPTATGTGNAGPDKSPRVYKSDGTPIPYVWAFDINRILSRGPA